MSARGCGGDAWMVWCIATYWLYASVVDTFKCILQDQYGVQRAVLAHLILDTLLALPVSAARATLLVASQLADIDTVALVYLRLLVIFAALIKAALSVSLYMDVRWLVRSMERIRREGSRPDPTNMPQEIRHIARWTSCICLGPAGALVTLHSLDLWMSTLYGLQSSSTTNQVLTVCVYVLLVGIAVTSLCSLAVVKKLQDAAGSYSPSVVHPRPEPPPVEGGLEVDRYCEVLTAPLDNTCCICLEALECGEEAALLPCGHQFHRVCLQPWVCRHGRCPLRCDPVRREAPPQLRQTVVEEDQVGSANSAPATQPSAALEVGLPAVEPVSVSHSDGAGARPCDIVGYSMGEECMV